METEMTKQVNQTKMVAQPKQEKMVRVVALQPFQTGTLKFDNGGQVVEDTTKMVQPGTMVEVTESKARELCKKIEGAYAFSGERYNADGDITKHDLTRARLATKRDLTPQMDETLDKVEGI